MAFGAGDRVLWLLLVPTVGTLAPWVLLFFGLAERDAGNTLQPASHFMTAATPVVGLLGTAGFLVVVKEVRRLVALVPLTIAVAGFAMGEIIIGVVDDAYLEFTTQWYGNVQLVVFVSLFLMPVCAVASGWHLFRRMRRS